MRARVAVALLVVVLSQTGCTMWSKPAKGWSGATGGEQLERLFWQDVNEKDWRDLDRRIAPNFSGVSPAGAQDRPAFLHQLQSGGEVSLSDCAVQSNGADLMVACKLRRGGQSSSLNSLSVWQQVPKGWLMVSHAEAPAP